MKSFGTMRFESHCAYPATICTTSAGTLDGDFTGPPQCWATRLTRFQVWPTISCHLFLTETADHAGWQDTLDKDILLQDELFAGRRAHGPKDRASLFGHLLPDERAHQRLHIDQSFYALRIALRPVKAQGRSPVMHNERDSAVQSQCIKPGIEVTSVIDEAIGVMWCLPRTAHAYQVRSQATPIPLQVRNDVTPEIGRRGIPVQEDNRVACPGIDVGHVGIEDGYPLALVRVSSRDCGLAHRCTSFFQGVNVSMVGARCAVSSRRKVAWITASCCSL